MVSSYYADFITVGNADLSWYDVNWLWKGNCGQALTDAVSLQNTEGPAFVGLDFRAATPVAMLSGTDWYRREASSTQMLTVKSNGGDL